MTTTTPYCPCCPLIPCRVGTASRHLNGLSPPNTVLCSLLLYCHFEISLLRLYILIIYNLLSLILFLYFVLLRVPCFNCIYSALSGCQIHTRKLVPCQLPKHLPVSSALCTGYYTVQSIVECNGSWIELRLSTKRTWVQILCECFSLHSRSHCSVAEMVYD